MSTHLAPYDDVDVEMSLARILVYAMSRQLPGFSPDPSWVVDRTRGLISEEEATEACSWLKTFNVNENATIKYDMDSQGHAVNARRLLDFNESENFENAWNLKLTFCVDTDQQEKFFILVKNKLEELLHETKKTCAPQSSGRLVDVHMMLSMF